jgi:hypothetical protein
VLDSKSQVGTLDGALQSALRDYSARSAIRTVHLRGYNFRLQAAIVSLLTPRRRRDPA